MATQQEIATHLGLSLKGARNQLAKLGLDNKIHNIDHIRKTYIQSLDSVGQSRAGQLDVTSERVKLMKAQATKLKLETKSLRAAVSEEARPTIGENTQDLLSDSMNEASLSIENLIELINGK